MNNKYPVPINNNDQYLNNPYKIKKEEKIMKVFFDTEFEGLYKDAKLVSIGLITEDNKQFYAEINDSDFLLGKYPYDRKTEWLQEHVIKNLYIKQEKQNKSYIPNYHFGSKEEIAITLGNWLSQFDTVELISDVSHYDMVLFADLFDGAMNIPKNVCPACYDINQDIMKKYNCSMQEAFDMSREYILYQNYKENKIIGQKHNALYDAKVIKEVYNVLNGDK